MYLGGPTQKDSSLRLLFKIDRVVRNIERDLISKLNLMVLSPQNHEAVYQSHSIRSYIRHRFIDS